MSYTVDFKDVSTTGVETSPVAPALAGLRANEARYFKNKYSHVFTVQPASEATAVIDWVHDILKTERDLVIESTTARGDRVRGRGDPDGVRVLRVRPVDQRDVRE